VPYENANGNESREGNELAVAMVLDKSGSMGVLRDAVIEGFNDYLAELRTEPAETSFWLTLFDTRFSKMWVGEPLDRVPPLDAISYRPGGMTALYDAIAHTVIDTDRRLAGEGKEHVKTLVVVMTDGLENSSTEYDAARLARLVRSYEERPNWTFVYLGAAHDTLEDAQLEAVRMGWKRENAMRWQATPPRPRRAWRRSHMRPRSAAPRAGSRATLSSRRPIRWRTTTSGVPPPSRGRRESSEAR
jgi:uncharacterized protein YegL